MAQLLATILLELSPGESVETTQIYSPVGLVTPGQSLLRQRPSRATRHTVSEADPSNCAEIDMAFLGREMAVAGSG